MCPNRRQCIKHSKPNTSPFADARIIDKCEPSLMHECMFIRFVRINFDDSKFQIHIT